MKFTFPTFYFLNSYFSRFHLSWKDTTKIKHWATVESWKKQRKEKKKRIGQLFDACLLSGQSLILWAETQGGPLFARSESTGFTGFPPPRAGCGGCWLYILIPSIPIPPSPPPPSVLFTPCRPCGCATSETFETTKALPDRPMAASRRWKRERCCSGRGVVLMAA